MKHKIVGIINILFGLPITLQFSMFLYFAFVNFNLVNQETNTLRPTTNTYILAVVLLILGLVNLFSGFSQFTQNQQKFQKLAIICLILNFIFLGLYIFKI